MSASASDAHDQCISISHEGVTQHNNQGDDNFTMSRTSAQSGGESSSDDTHDCDSYDPTDPYSAWEHFYKGRKMKAQFSGLFNLVRAHNETSASLIRDSSPWNDTSTREAHNIEQRIAWNELCKKVAADASIPIALFDPPESFVQVVFIRDDKDWFCCPCAVPDQKCSYMALDAPVNDGGEGVTKNMLLEKIGHVLYGAEDGSGWQVGNENERPVLKLFSTMQSEGTLVGDIYAVLKGIEKTETNEEDQDNAKKTSHTLNTTVILCHDILVGPGFWVDLTEFLSAVHTTGYF